MSAVASDTRWYRAYGRSIESNCPLPELPDIEVERSADVRLSWGGDARLPPDLGWTTIWPATPGQDAVRFARRRDWCYLRFEGTACIIISPRHHLQIVPDADADPVLVRHVVLDQALPLALAAAGHLVLHASAVRVDEGAVLFVGDAGSGKSTVAAALAQQGCAVLADDGLLLDERCGVIRAVVSYSGLRLWPDAAEAMRLDGFTAAPGMAGTSKRRLYARDVETIADPLPVHALYTLQRGSRLRFEPLSRRDLTLALVRHAFTPDASDREALRYRLDAAARSAAGLHGWALTAQETLERVGELARAVLTHARAAASGRLLGR